MLDPDKTVEFTSIDETALGEDQAFELNGYSNIRQIGAGGMATVYSATQNSFQRTVAIKALLPAYAADVDFAKRFLREAQIVSQLSHPHIIPVYDFGQKDGTFYMVMDYMAGGDLAHRIKKGISVDEILAIIGDIATALHFAHEKGFVHRDVKPDNIMFREDNSAVLTDFGIARKQSSENQMTVAGQILGTPKYMSPEQLQGREVDGRTDIYSLGIMFYEMLAKKCPYDDEDFMALAMMHIQAPIPKLPEPFGKFQKFFERMVAKQPEHRFQSGQEIAKVIQQVRSGKSDAAKIDSGGAASLKKELAENASKNTTQTAGNVAAPTTRLASNAMVILHDIDPVLNEDWNETVSNIFANLKPNERKFVYAEILKPKGIIFDSESKEFVFYGRKSVADVQEETRANSAIQAIAQKVIQAQQSLMTTRDLKVFADIVEGCISTIDRYDADDNLKAQKDKMALRAAFLDDLVSIVRNSQFDVPPNRRSLTVDGIKSYILQVYIKHEMFGYRFKTVSIGTLEKDPHEFLRAVVAHEARIRQCDIVRTTDHIYLIGPVRDPAQNPYSIRRFMTEDESMGGQVVYFNAVAIPLSKIDIPQAQETIKWLLSRIVTLERQLSQNIVNFVAEIEKTREQYLSPMLSGTIAADGSDIETATANKMKDFEKKLSMLVLGKVPKALDEFARTIDDYEFLFFSLRRMLIELACDVRDFASQSATSMSEKAEELDMKMMSFIKLLDKRKVEVFCATKDGDLDPAQDNKLLFGEINSTLDECDQTLAKLNVKLREVIQKQSIEKNGFEKFLEKLFGPPKKKEITPEDVENEILAARRRSLLAIIRIIKRYQKISIYLELEDIIAVDETQRHYALATGKNGITRLPTVIRLFESATQFKVEALREPVDAAASS